MKYVIDANVVIDWITLANDQNSPVHKISDLTLLKKIELCAPSYLVSEVCNVLKQRYKYTEKKIYSVVKTLESLNIYYLNIDYQHWPELLNVSFVYNLTIYDSYYLLTAIQTKAKIITRDKALLATDLGISPQEAVSV